MQNIMVRGGGMYAWEKSNIKLHGRKGGRKGEKEKIVYERCKMPQLCIFFGYKLSTNLAVYERWENVSFQKGERGGTIEMHNSKYISLSGGGCSVSFLAKFLREV